MDHDPIVIVWIFLFFIFLCIGALIRRGDDRRRASLGAGIPGALRTGDSASFDPNHAAILFRDSRGVSLNSSLFGSY